jgi:RimJ/RimL family protein N-acetyltransferase
MIFQTARLDMRPWHADDAERVFDMYSRWEVARWLGATPQIMDSLDEARASIERRNDLSASSGGRFGSWAVEVRETGVVAGTVLFKLLPNSDSSPASDVEVGWHFHPDSWGHGYATESAKGAIDRGFDLGLPESFAVVYPDNSASLAVCRRLGMSPIGRTDRWYGVEVEAFRAERQSRPPA